MKRRFPICILAASMLGSIAYPAAAEVHDPAVQTVIEEAAESAEQAEEEKDANDASSAADGASADDAASDGSGLTEDIAAAIEQASETYSFKYEPGKGLQPANPETEELMSNLGVLADVLRSEEFQRLLEYPEMQALMKTALDRLIQFVTEEPELATKVLVALGADESAVNLMMKGVDLMKPSE
ncbi:MAG: hypothetical protein J6D53_06785 [Blautia sp.]|nr:hypothetical protein [Blautia sp.]